MECEGLCSDLWRLFVFVLLTLALQTLEVICSFDDGSDEVSCAAFNPVNPCLFAFADVSGAVGLRALDRSLDAALAGSANVDIAVNCMGAYRWPHERALVFAFVITLVQIGHATENCWLWEA